MFGRRGGRDREWNGGAHAAKFVSGFSFTVFIGTVWRYYSRKYVYVQSSFWTSVRTKAFKEFLAAVPALTLGVSARRKRSVKLVERITVEPGKCGGRPCIRGLRIRVKDILEMLADGAKPEEILADFPDLEADDIKAALLYAAGGTDRVVLKAA
ncbi:MAG: DUF433 domain-containing protein [Pedosphaera sp.]|nr:DUF433 domain-containing protein [Pedosphaera sp.]